MRSVQSFRTIKVLLSVSISSFKATQLSVHPRLITSNSLFIFTSSLQSSPTPSISQITPPKISSRYHPPQNSPASKLLPLKFSPKLLMSPDSSSERSPSLPLPRIFTHRWPLWVRSPSRDKYVDGSRADGAIFSSWDPLSDFEGLINFQGKHGLSITLHSQFYGGR